ncbi:hypothetical protein [Ralstonia chuxiongensis]|uniref:Transmembrane protein n=1 Tax=Ralstonia chuxiongensis TaxID=2957504 RepID=A0AA41WSC4_9RALS|nr:hypothetical protein [Ralstonia chuxiongensis]MCP1174318.1 hypothetical protein [Ralstonia chuxiongensis]
MRGTLSDIRCARYAKTKTCWRRHPASNMEKEKSLLWHLRYVAIGLVPMGLIALALAYLFSENIEGARRHQHYCSTVAGLRVFHPLEPHTGWLADRKSEAKSLASRYPQISFARFEERGIAYDVRWKGGAVFLETSYDIQEASPNDVVTYQYLSVSDEVPGELRLRRYGDAVYDLKTGKLAARAYDFTYSWFDLPFTDEGRSTPRSCHNELHQTHEELRGAFAPTAGT